MIVRSLDINYDPFRYWKKNEEIFGPEVPCHTVIERLMYLTMYTWFDILFLTYSLAKYDSSPIWKYIKHVLCYYRSYLSDSLNNMS